MTDVLSTSISGLRVSQNAIRTTGHNIANANTEGYSRQRTEINSVAGASLGGLNFGGGAITKDINRIADEFLIQQLRVDTSLHSELNTYNEFIQQLDQLLANESTSLSNGLQSFFNALQNASDDPASIPARELVLGESGSLTNRFDILYARLEAMQDNVATNLNAAVNRINSLTQTIAEINRSITNNQSGTGSLPSDLLDKRDQAIKELSEIVSVQVSTQDDRISNVSLANGFSLVLGADAAEFRIGNSEYDAGKPEIFSADTALSTPVTDLFTGGEIGGLKDFQQTVIEPAFNEIGRLALAVAEKMNELQGQGLTLDNRFGSNLFTDINTPAQSQSRVFGSSNNTNSNQVMSVDITDISQLTSSDYLFSVDNSGTSYNVVRRSDEQIVSSGNMPGALPSTISFDGLELNLTAGTFSGSDSFLIQPTRFGGRDLEVVGVSPRDLALASPVVSDTDLGNRGTADISPGQVLQSVDSNDQLLPLFANQGSFTPPLLVQFTTDTTYDILDNSNPANPVQLNPPLRNQAYNPSQQNNLFDAAFGGTTVVSQGTALGLPAANTANNGYPSETLTFTTTDPASGTTTTQTLTTVANASAKTTAQSLSNLTGVTANAFNYLELRDFSVTRAVPLQLTVNGQDLVAYDGAAIDSSVPDPTINSGEDFNDYLAAKINNNDTLKAQGIYAVSAYDAASSEFYIQVHSTQGDDLTVGFEGLVGQNIEVNDGNNADVAINGAGAGTTNTLVVGGRIDVEMADNIAMTTTPATSAIFGNSAAPTFARDNLFGIQASISGNALAGDRFTLDFNSDAIGDNRNALSMIGLQEEDFLAGNSQSINDVYGTMVEQIGVKTNASNENTEAAKAVLDQTEELRNSVSGVNLDEEAASLIRFEQLYQANAQVISVARELFSQLINSF